MTSNSVDNATAISEKDSVEVGIIVALREEFRELHSFLPSPESILDSETGFYDYMFKWPVTNDASYYCAATMIGEMGPTEAALACEQFINRRQPKTIVMLGIAAGLNEDVKLGDVVLVKDVNMYLERAKAVDGKTGETFEFQPGGTPYSCSKNLVRASLNLESAHSNLYQQWQSVSKTDLTNDQFNELLQKHYIREQPVFLSGSIASGSVVGAAKPFVGWIKKINRNYLALEMESGGMLAAVYGHSEPKKTLILRGISDFGDDRKQQLDQFGKGGIRRYAMRNATRLLWKLLEAQILPRATDSSSEERRIGYSRPPEFSRRKFRELIEALTPQEFRKSLDDFPDVRREFVDGQQQYLRVEIVLDYFELHQERIEELLKAIKNCNLTAYEKYLLERKSG